MYQQIILYYPLNLYKLNQVEVKVIYQIQFELEQNHKMITMYYLMQTTLILNVNPNHLVSPPRSFWVPTQQIDGIVLWDRQFGDGSY